MIYLHYASEDRRTSAEDGIYLACVRRIRAGMEAAVFNPVATAADPREQLRRSADAFLAFQEEQPRRWALVFSPSGLSNSDLDRELTRERFRAIGIIADLFAAHAPDADRDRLEACTHSLSGSLDQRARRWATRPDIPRSVLLEHHMAFAWNGLQQLLRQQA